MKKNIFNICNSVEVSPFSAFLETSWDTGLPEIRPAGYLLFDIKKRVSEIFLTFKAFSVGYQVHPYKFLSYNAPVPVLHESLFEIR